MSSSIEFGVLEDWSTVSLIPDCRVDLDDAEFLELAPVLARITARTGIEFDLYESACLENAAIDVFIEEVSVAYDQENGAEPAILKRLLSAAHQAQQLSRPLQYRGL